MTVLADFIVPAEEFVLADTLTTSPEMRIEIKRVVSTDGTVTPYFWVSGDNFESFEQSIRGDDSIDDIRMLEREPPDGDGGSGQEERFYRVTWKIASSNLITAASDAKATILEAATGDGARWEVKVLFPDDGTLSSFHEYCRQNDFDVEPERVYRPENPQEQAVYGVTEQQQEALELAFHGGYFNVPRDTKLCELAEELGISENATSARIRRGTGNLLANTIVHEQ